MKEQSKKTNKFLVIGIIILFIIIIGLCGYIFLGKTNEESISGNTKNNLSDSKKDETKVDSENKETLENNNGLIIFDASKVINSNEKDYTLAYSGNAGIYALVDSSQKVLTFSYKPSKVVEDYSLNWTSNRDDIVSSKINFDKKIVDVFFGGMGQDASGDTLFILLEDGTLEYIPIVHMFNNAQEQVVSYGKVNGVSDIVKLVSSSTSAGVTTLAIKSDGSFYDLWYALENTGNY